MNKLIRNWSLLFLCLCLIGYGCNRMFPSETMVKEKKVSKTETNEKTKASFTFMGVGDNLLHDVIFHNNDLSLKDIDYNDIYTNMKKYTKEDINYINYETICAGTENGLELGGYPSFNGPTAFNDAVANAGFNWFSLCSNHTYDRGTTGVLTELEYLKEHEPNVTITGAYASQKEANTPTVIKVNGIKVGLASYAYGFESEPTNDSDTEWMVNKISEEKIRSDMKKLNKVSDVQIVSMHWGTEYQTTPDDDQEKYAKLLNELGVEVIIGTHPHVIEPVEWIHSKNQDTLCYYSLGNLISAQNATENMIGGMARFKCTYDFKKKKAKVSDAEFLPTITYYDSNFNNYALYTIKEWTDKQAETHEVTVTEGGDMTKKTIQDYVKEVMQNVKGVKVILK